MQEVKYADLAVQIHFKNKGRRFTVSTVPKDPRGEFVPSMAFDGTGLHIDTTEGGHVYIPSSHIKRMELGRVMEPAPEVIDEDAPKKKRGRPSKKS